MTLSIIKITPRKGNSSADKVGQFTAKQGPHRGIFGGKVSGQVFQAD